MISWFHSLDTWDGRAFRNDRTWIDAAMRRALHLVSDVDLDVRIA